MNNVEKTTYDILEIFVKHYGGNPSPRFKAFIYDLIEYVNGGSCEKKKDKDK